MRGTHALNLLTADGMSFILARTDMGLNLDSRRFSRATMRGYAIGTPAAVPRWSVPAPEEGERKGGGGRGTHRGGR